MTELNQPPAPQRREPPSGGIPRSPQFRTNSSAKPGRPLLVTILAVIFFLNAGLAGLGIIGTLAAAPLLGVEIQVFNTLAALGQTALYLAAGFGLWNLTRWSWWLMIIYQPFRFAYSLTSTLLVLPYLGSLMSSYAAQPLDPEMAQMVNRISTYGMFIGLTISFAITLMVLFVFWLNQDAFFGNNEKAHISAGEFAGVLLVSALAGAAVFVGYAILLKAYYGLPWQELLLQIAR